MNESSWRDRIRAKWRDKTREVLAALDEEEPAVCCNCGQDPECFALQGDTYDDCYYALCCGCGGEL